MIIRQTNERADNKMIDKEKLREFLMSRNQEANNEVAKDSAVHLYYYNLGQSHATDEIITKLDSGEFDTEEGKHDSD